MPSENDKLAEATLLIVETDPHMLIAIRDTLEGGGYRVDAVTDAKAALKLLDHSGPDLIISAISMPEMDGIELYKAVRQRPEGVSIPFIFTAARGTREEVFAAKSLGVDDFITAPFTSNELLASVRGRLQRSDELALAQMKAVIRAMSNALQARAGVVALRHVEAVSAYAQALGHELGWGQDDLEVLELGAILHDFGKIGVPERVLSKNSALDEDEWAEMRMHPIYGAHMIEGNPHLYAAESVVRNHHEWWDGSGYPDGLAGSEIPEAARLVAVANAFDNMTRDLPYRSALSPGEAHDEILSKAGSQFDPFMVEAFESCWQRGDIATIYKSVQSMAKDDS